MGRRNDWVVNLLIVVLAIGVIMLLGYEGDDYAVDTPASIQSRTESAESSISAKPATTTKSVAEETYDKVALPDTIYAVVDESLVIRFLNITGYNSLDHISVSVDDDGNGKLYEDRWECTPKAAGSFRLAFEVKDKDGVVVNKSAHTVQVKAVTKKKTLSVLVIGDSTIEGGYETKKMLDLATEDGHQFTLLGTRTTDYVKDENNRHEGRGGWKASTYVEKEGSKNTGAVNAFYNPQTKTFDFAYYMEEQGYSSVDCVCLQLGINDMFGARRDAEVLSKSYIKNYFEHMDTIIKSIHQYDPTIQIIWNLILPGSVEQEKFEQAYGEDGQTADRYKRNTYLANLEIIKHVQGMENVHVAPTNAPLNTVEHMYLDGGGAVHPARKGYFEIGAMLYNCVLAATE